MYANIFGDFVKGSNLDHFPEKIQQGIKLHREIDSFIDHHPAVKDLLHQIYPSLPKIAGIAVDMLFDFLLIKHWKTYSIDNFDGFVNRFYSHTIKDSDYPSQEFHFMLLRMKQSDWLRKYATLDGIEKACLGISKRISFPNTLSNATTVYRSEKKVFEEAFSHFMNDAVPYFQQFNSAKGK